jgi:E3 ubiquitin-protein ligase DOA10
LKKIKQVVAIVMCVLLVGMYVASFVAAIFAKPQAHGLFMASVGMTIMIPLLLYAYTIIYRVIHPEVHKEDEMYEDMEKYDDGGGLNGENNGGEPDSENNAGGNNDDNRDKGN